jgi:hypothetical protein
MKIKNMKYVLTIIALVFVSGIWAQKDDIVLEMRANRTVEPAFRILAHPKIIDTVKAAQVKAYPLLFFQVPTKISLDSIEAATVETTEKLKQQYPFYAKVGVGSTIMPLGELYFNSTRSRAYQYGANVKHLSSFGDIKNREKVVYAPAQYDRTNATVFGKINERNYNLLGEFNYQNNGFHYYGVQDDSLSKDSIAQRFQVYNGSAEYVANRGDSARLNFKIKTDYTNFQTRKIADTLADWRAIENHFNFNSRLWYNNRNERFYGDIGVRYNGYSYGILDSVMSVGDTGISNQNTIIDFKPGVWTQMLDNRLKIEIGVGITADLRADKNTVYLYPQAEFKYAMFNDIFIPYLGIKGGLKQNTIQSLTSQNPFIRVNQQLLNEHNPFDIYGGFKGTLSKRMSFNIGASFAHIENKALFVTDTFGVYRNQFNVIYDTLNLTTIEGSLSYQMSEKLKIDGIARFYSYEMYNQARAWNLPQFQCLVRGSYNLYDKFSISLDGTLETGRNALVYATGEGVKEENGQYFVSLGTIVDLNLGVEYRYSQRISAFLQLNNVAAQRYNRWYNYPVQPFQVMGGVTARF